MFIRLLFFFAITFISVNCCSQSIDVKKINVNRNFAIDNLGDVNDTFLLVHNLSTANDGGYIMEIKS